mmetsp:Transcript_24072/g.75714  ORF Transcript_24072/g.75714 Transcript_24072/m.75714 type:complete len:200 (-) Transcript_24072:805-1404(-)
MQSSQSCSRTRGCATFARCGCKVMATWSFLLPSPRHAIKSALKKTCLRIAPPPRSRRPQSFQAAATPGGLQRRCAWMTSSPQRWCSRRALAQRCQRRATPRGAPATMSGNRPSHQHFLSTRRHHYLLSTFRHCRGCWGTCTRTPVTACIPCLRPAIQARQPRFTRPVPRRARVRSKLLLQQRQCVAAAQSRPSSARCHP